MPTDHETGEKHAFKWWPPFMSDRPPDVDSRCKLCGQPPDAEVHRMPDEHPAWPATEADCAPLPATEKPAEARGIEDQSQALMLAVLHWHDTAHRMNTKEPASRCPYGPCQWAQDGIRTLRALASPPPQAQPEEE